MLRKEFQDFLAARPGVIAYLADLSVTDISDITNKNDKLRVFLLLDDEKKLQEWQRLIYFLRAHPPLQDDSYTAQFGTVFAATETSFTSQQVHLLNEAVKRVGYQVFHATVLACAIYASNWQNPAVFAAIKNQLASANIQDIIIFADNIVSRSKQNIALQILENIYSLAPSLVLHTNLNVKTQQSDQGVCLNAAASEPLKALHKLSHAISFMGQIHQLHSNLALFPKQEDYRVSMHKKLQRQSSTMALHNDLKFNDIQIYLLNTILSMAGVNLNCNYLLELSRTSCDLICSLPLPLSELDKIIVALNTRFKGFAVDYAAVSAQKHLPNYTLGLALNIEYIIQHIMPAIPLFFSNNNTQVVHYQRAHEVYSEMNKLFSEFGISIANTHCFEQTLCRMAKHYARTVHQQDVSDLISSYSLCKSDTLLPLTTSIYLTTPLPAAAWIVTYITALSGDAEAATLSPTAEYLPEHDILFTKVCVKNEVFLSADFKAAARRMLNTLAEEVLRTYQYNSGKRAFSAN